MQAKSSFLDLRNPILEPIPLRPIPLANFHESLHVPKTTRPISEGTTYTNRTSRRGSLETNPPHLARGEHPQIMSAREVDLGSQLRTPPPSPPLHGRLWVIKIWVGWCIMGALIVYLITNLALLIPLVLESSRKPTTVYVKPALLTWSENEMPGLDDVPSPPLGGSGDLMSSSSTTADATKPNIYIFQHAPETVAAISETAPRMQDSVTATISVGVTVLHAELAKTTNVIIISTATVPFATTMAGAHSPITVTKTITAQPPGLPDPSQYWPPTGTVTMALEFTVVNSAGGRSTKRTAAGNTLFAFFLVGGIIVCHRGL